MGGTSVWQAWCAIDGLRWYAGLVRPTFSPSPALAAAGAAVLALLVGRAFFRVLRSADYLPDRPTAIRLFLLALALDALWAWMFFAGQHPTVALAAAGALAVVTASAAWHAAAVDRRAGLLLIPWVGAVAFVFLLDLSISSLNR